MATFTTMAAGSDFSANAIRFFPPVAAGLQAWYFLSGGTAALITKDQSGNGNAATLAGSPTISVGSVAFTGNTGGQWLQTPVLETADITVQFAAQTTDTLLTGATRPQFVSAFATDTSAITAGHGIYVLGRGPTGTDSFVQLHADWANGTTDVGNNVSLDSGPPQTWAFYTASIVSATGVMTLTDHTNNATGTVTQATYPRAVNVSNPLRLGGGYTGSGECAMAFAAIYNRALSSAEAAKNYAFVRNYLLASSHGGIVI